MRLSHGVAFAVAAVSTAATLGVVTPSQASSAGAIAGSCDLVKIEVTREADGDHRLSTPGQGVCTVSEYNGLHIASNAAQIGAQIEITAPDVNLVCTGRSARGFSGPVTVAIHGNDTDSFPDVTMVVDSAPGGQALNPTATMLVDGLRFAGAGTFTRSGSGDCSHAAWTLGHLTFEDPTLGGTGSSTA